MANRGSSKITDPLVVPASSRIPFSLSARIAEVNAVLLEISVSSEESERGLEQIILGATFKLIPQTKRIFLFVRPTNEPALAIYKDLEFVPDLALFQDPNHKINTNYLTPLECRVELGQVLQKTATENLIKIECSVVGAAN